MQRESSSTFLKRSLYYMLMYYIQGCWYTKEEDIKHQLAFCLKKEVMDHLVEWNSVKLNDFAIQCWDSNLAPMTLTIIFFFPYSLLTLQLHWFTLLPRFVPLQFQAANPELHLNACLLLMLCAEAVTLNTDSHDLLMCACIFITSLIMNLPLLSHQADL